MGGQAAHAVDGEDEDGGTGGAQRLAQRWSQQRRPLDAQEPGSACLDQWTEVESMRRDEERVEVLGERRDREMLEDAATVVVEHEEDGPQAVATCREQAADVVQEAQVAAQADR